MRIICSHLHIKSLISIHIAPCTSHHHFAPAHYIRQWQSYRRMSATRQLRSSVKKADSNKVSASKKPSAIATRGTKPKTKTITPKVEAPETPIKSEADTQTTPKSSKRKAIDTPTSSAKKVKATVVNTKSKSKTGSIVTAIKIEETKPKTKSKKTTVILGTDPYPEHHHPTPDESQIVHDLLTKAHGPAIQPDKVPVGTTWASGCGEVPSVLDAVIRTLLSANTSGANSTRAFRGLVSTFGWDKVNNCANWEAVRKASQPEVKTAIEKGGLANVKSKSIKKILDEVYEDGQKSGNGLSLDYLHEMNDVDAMAKLTSFGGVGVKTATCVMMFCLRRAAFPVDTHVFRLAKLLGWVPTTESKREADEANIKTEGTPKKTPPVTRDTTFLHLDVAIPAKLKYGLHQLLIKHGKYCPVCTATGGRKLGINQHGKPLVNGSKSMKEEEMDVDVKEEDDQTEDEDEEKTKDGVTGRKGGGLPDGGCILGDRIRWERLI